MMRVRIWFVVLISLIGVMLFIALVGIGLVRHSWPQTSGSVVLPNLTEPVEIIRDEWGVPHIYAPNEQALFFAQGYVHAQDRLWQMDMNRRMGSGTMSALLGEESIEADRFLRAMSLRQLAEEEWASLDDAYRDILVAYTDGVNAYIETNHHKLPLEYTLLNAEPQPWSPVDTLVWGKAMSLFLGANIDFEIVRARLIAELGPAAAEQLLPSYGNSEPLIIPSELGDMSTFRGIKLTDFPGMPGQLGAHWGSNAWVINGSRTTTGKPFLANDPHLNLSLPSVWYKNGLHGGRFDVVGFTFPGVPAVVIGHNESIAWGLTNLLPDVQDLYVEKLDDPDNPSQYKFMGEWKPLEIVTEVFDVRGHPARTEKFIRTHHGPIVNQFFPGWIETDPIALQWTTLSGGGIFQAIIQLNLATNWQMFREALSYWEIAGASFVYADVEGNIGYQATSRIPIRVPNHQGLVPVPGWTGEYEWQGFIPYAELPHIFNPQRNFIVTANNKVTSDEYPYHLAYEWSAPYRAEHITNFLNTNEAFSLEDMKQLQAQTYALPAEVLLPYILAIEPANELEAQALEHLSTWDLNHDLDSVGSGIYQVWYWFFVQNTLQDELGEDLLDAYLQLPSYANTHITMLKSIVDKPDNVWFNNVQTSDKEERDEIVHQSLADAVTALEEEFGDSMEEWAWGNFHSATFEHWPFGQSGVMPLELLFNSRPIPVSGDNFTVNAGWYSFSDPFGVNLGSSLRMIVDLDNFDNSLSIMPPGQSGHLFHKHRLDLISLWQNVEYHPMLFTRKAVEANIEGTLYLVPDR
jgi:penicillin G amidase